jgi:hypothetical protein
VYRIRIGCHLSYLTPALDAADAAFATLYGGARLARFEVWADRLPEVAPVAVAPVAVVPAIEAPRVVAAAFESAHAAA